MHFLLISFDLGKCTRCSLHINDKSYADLFVWVNNILLSPKLFWDIHPSLLIFDILLPELILHINDKSYADLFVWVYSILLSKLVEKFWYIPLP